MPVPDPITSIEPTGGHTAAADLAADADESDDALVGVPVPLDAAFETPTADAIEQHHVVPDDDDEAWEHQ